MTDALRDVMQAMRRPSALVLVLTMNIYTDNRVERYLNVGMTLGAWLLVRRLGARTDAYNPSANFPSTERN